MSQDMNQLYQDMILDHNKNPRNFKTPSSCSNCAQGKNPLCGDDYKVFLKIEHDVIVEASFYGHGCVISKSSGSIMTTLVTGKTVEEARKIVGSFVHMLTKETSKPGDIKILGRARIFEGVRKYPVRVKCATLIWRALESALDHESGDRGTVSTENA